MQDDFDCVDLYKQPAFQHPLLKNHKIQLFPTFTMSTMQLGRDNKDKHSRKRCPMGKVPIFKTNIREQKINMSTSKSQLDGLNQYSQSRPRHHFATLSTTQNMMFHGASAQAAVYNLSLQANQYSLSQIWIQGGPPTDLNSIQVGCGVHPNLFGDSQVRLIAYWTADGFRKTGCFNHQCPGFVQVHREFTFGEIIGPPSIIGSDHKSLYPFKVKQDQSTGHWWLIAGKGSWAVGYWPNQLLTHLSHGSSVIRYGGETYASPNVMSPPMGSGRLPRELYKNSAFMSNLEIIDSNYNEVRVNPKYMKSNCDTTPNCYDVQYHGYEGIVFAQAFLYGGPGGQCGI
ncbi:uncharacterized protein LOC130714592 [Lotus japonicus]|uniref:uncharacterized protein LOC130714592 n=1 Tax=Lotus japonicus TaxID=34305 RepID=UPI002584E793|nr:uncharacterized protein LOC130714592 [Lotus japonicus]